MRPHLPRIFTFNDTVEWLGVFMDNGFACTEKNATESVTVAKENSFGKGRVRGHMRWLTHHSRIFTSSQTADQTGFLFRRPRELPRAARSHRVTMI